MSQIISLLQTHGIVLGTLPALAIGFAARHYGPQIKAWLTNNEDLLVMRALNLLKTELRKKNVPPQTIMGIETDIVEALNEAAKIVQKDEATPPTT